MRGGERREPRGTRARGARGADERRRTDESSWGTEAAYRSLFLDSPVSLWVEDFSEIKTCIEGLRSSGVRDFRLHFEKDPEEVARLATMVQVVDANRATLELYEARSVDDFREGLGVVFTEESHDTFREELIAIAEGESRFDAEATTRTLTGERRHVLLRWAVAPGHERTLSRVLVSIIDVTEREQAKQALRESEERLQKLSEAAFEGIAVHDKGRILDANDAFATMFGYERSEVVGMTAWDLTAPESRDLVSRQVLTGREEPYEIIGLRKDGTTFPVETCGKAIHYEGRMVRVAAMRDITDRKRAEDALQRAREELEDRVERQMQRAQPYGLTFRELSVLHLMAEGKANREIGVELGISYLTVEKHVAHILEKMGVSSRTEASVKAVRHGLINT